jgi:hypothetical protein
MLKTASDYCALRALMGWSFGANDAQIGIVMPHLLAKYARSIRVKMPDGTFEGIGLGLLGNMQAVEAMHADLKLAMRALTNGHGDCWHQLMQLDSISKVMMALMTGMHRNVLAARSVALFNFLFHALA